MYSELNSIWLDWRAKVPNGVPNPSNDYHLVLLKELCLEKGIDKDIIDNVMLVMEKADKVDPDTPIKYKMKNKKGDMEDMETTYKSALQRDKEHPAYIAAKALQSDDGDDEEEKEPTKQMKIDPEGGLGKKDGEEDVDDVGAEDGEEVTVYDEDLAINDDDFKEKNKNNQTQTPYELPENVFNNPKFPKKYGKLLERMLNTNGNSKDGTKYIGYFGIGEQGAGGSEANIGELLTMMSTTLRRKEANELFNSIEEHLTKVKTDGQKTHVGPQWVKAAKQNRRITLAIFRDKFGNGYEIEAGAWDVEKEVEAMGMDYKEKGYSTDVFFKVKDKEGSSVFAEISLKQSLGGTNLHNGGVTSTFKGHELPDHVNDKKYSDNQVENNDLYYNANQQNVLAFINELDTEDSEFDEKLTEVARVMSPNSKSNQEDIINQFKDMIVQTKEDLLSNPDLKFDRDYIGNITQVGAKTKGGFTGARKQTLKPLVVLARLQADYGDDTAREFIETQKKLNKDYNLALAKHIGENEEAKETVLNSIKEKLPLKSVAEGEEDIVIADIGLTQKTLRAVFGTDDWSKIKDNLIVDTSNEAKPTITYVGKVKGQDRVIPISTLVIREDGIGYKGGHKFDMKLDSRFGAKIRTASAEIYADQIPIPAPIGQTTQDTTGTREPVV